MLTLLLTLILFIVMKYVKTIIKFIIIIHHHIHNKNTLFYIKNVLIRINLLKNVFKKYRFQKNTNQTKYNKKHFNFFK